MTPSSISKAWREEPVAFITAVLSVLIAFGAIAFTDAQLTEVLALVALLSGGGAVTRSQVSPAGKDPEA